MENLVVNENFNNKKVFMDFPHLTNTYIPAAKDMTSADTFETKEEKKQSHKLAVTITLSALAVGFGTLAIFSGKLSKGITKLLEKWKIKLEQKAANSDSRKNFYRYSIGKIESFMQKTESINNFTTIKDVLVQRLMCGKDGQRTFTRKIHQGITRFFDKMSRKTVNSSYTSANRKFAELNELFAATNERILAQNHAHIDEINQINQRIQRVNSNLEKGFGIDARTRRLKEMRDVTDDLFEKFWNSSIGDMRNFRSRNMYNGFIAEDALLPTKMKMSNEVSVLRQLITHDISDTYKATSKAINNIQKCIKPTDVKTNKILNTLRKNLTEYNKLSGNNEAKERLVLNRKIIQNLKDLSTSLDPQMYDKEITKNISSYVKKVEELISKDSKGELQEILSCYKKLLPREEYLKLKKEANKAVKLLDNSIDIETNKYLDKIRDLRLGSAPTDVASMLFATGAVGYYLTKADTKDDRISAGLKYGTQAAGTIATSLYLTSKLVAGSKALAIGLASGWVIGKIGELIDNTRKKYAVGISIENKNKQKSQPDKV